MLKKLSLNKTQYYEKNIAVEQVAKMLVSYIRGVACPVEIGSEQGDISAWDDFVITNYDLSNIYIQVKRQTTSFGTKKDEIIRNDDKSGDLRKLTPFDKTFKSLAEATVGNEHIRDHFWICLPEDNSINIKNNLTVREFRVIWEDIKDVTRGDDLKNQVSVKPKTKDVYDWLNTWCGFKDWNHIVKALKLLEIKTFGYENDIQQRAKDTLKDVFNISDIEIVYNYIWEYVDSNSTYAGAFRPRGLLCELNKYLRPEIERWTMFKTDGSSWAILGINDLEQNCMEGNLINIERVSEVAAAFWGREHMYRHSLKIVGEYSKQCKVTQCLMRLSMHLEGSESTSSTDRKLWLSDLQNAVGGTLGNGENDFEGVFVSELRDELHGDVQQLELKKFSEKEAYAEALNNELHLVILKRISERMKSRLEKMESGELRDCLEDCWENWNIKLQSDALARKKFFTGILYSGCEGKSILGELRVGCRTIALMTEAIFLTMIVSVAFSENGKYDWSCLNPALQVRTIGLKFWSGSAYSAKDIVEISDDKEIAQLLSWEKEEVIVLSGTNDAVSDLLGTDMADNSLHNGLLSDRRQPHMLVSLEPKLKRLIKKGNIEEIRRYLQSQLDKYKKTIDKTIEQIIGK